MGKIRVEELAAQMGIGSKEVLFLLQSIGVDVKSPQAALDESTVLAILQGKTHAPKQLIVRDTESRAFRPQKSALSRIKIVEKPLAPRAEPEPEPAPEAEPAPPPPPPQRVATPPPAEVRPTGPAGPAGMASRPAAQRPTGPVTRPMGPASGSPSSRPGPSVYRPTPGGPGMRGPAGGPMRP